MIYLEPLQSCFAFFLGGLVEKTDFGLSFGAIDVTVGILGGVSFSALAAITCLFDCFTASVNAIQDAHRYLADFDIIKQNNNNIQLVLKLYH